ncbi:unnamed protein product [Paramecium octaurelia]|uniref:Uncharacterized protein n=1 Tax=Paramecium octaurelia TaxID=43137 RepID=A0A8S1YRG6_PAROT|nr:unnamed protein product [Paramecium octaurelia]
MSEKNPISIKLIVLGDANVGKVDILLRYLLKQVQLYKKIRFLKISFLRSLKITRLQQLLMGKRLIQVYGILLDKKHIIGQEYQVTVKLMSF